MSGPAGGPVGDWIALAVAAALIALQLLAASLHSGGTAPDNEPAWSGD